MSLFIAGQPPVPGGRVASEPEEPHSFLFDRRHPHSYPQHAHIHYAFCANTHTHTYTQRPLSQPDNPLFLFDGWLTSQREYVPPVEQGGSLLELRRNSIPSVPIPQAWDPSQLQTYEQCIQAVEEIHAAADVCLSPLGIRSFPLAWFMLNTFSESICPISFITSWFGTSLCHGFC